MPRQHPERIVKVLRLALRNLPADSSKPTVAPPSSATELHPRRVPGPVPENRPVRENTPIALPSQRSHPASFTFAPLGDRRPPLAARYTPAPATPRQSRLSALHKQTQRNSQARDPQLRRNPPALTSASPPANFNQIFHHRRKLRRKSLLRNLFVRHPEPPHLRRRQIPPPAFPVLHHILPEVRQLQPGADLV